MVLTDIDWASMRFTQPLDRHKKLDEEQALICKEVANEPLWKQSKFPGKQLDPIYETRKRRDFVYMRDGRNEGMPGKGLTRVFGPHYGCDLLNAEINTFCLEIQQPIKGDCYSPKFFSCHICGGGFGYSSIDKHIQQCGQRWDTQEAQNEPGEPMRPCPNKPSVSPA